MSFMRSCQLFIIYGLMICDGVLLLCCCCCSFFVLVSTLRCLTNTIDFFDDHLFCVRVNWFCCIHPMINTHNGHNGDFISCSRAMNIQWLNHSHGLFNSIQCRNCFSFFAKTLNLLVVKKKAIARDWNLTVYQFNHGQFYASPWQFGAISFRLFQFKEILSISERETYSICSWSSITL